jgi:hypothetical protein
MMLKPVSSACLYHHLEGNVHEFVLNDTSRQGVDELFDMMERLLSDAHARHDLSVITSSFLVDCRAGIPPLNQAFARAKRMSQTFRTHPLSRTACIFPSNTLVRTVGLFLRTVTPVRLYNPSERDEALAWLREPRSTPSP